MPGGSFTEDTRPYSGVPPADATIHGPGRAIARVVPRPTLRPHSRLRVALLRVHLRREPSHVMEPAIQGRLRACVRLVAGVVALLPAPALPVAAITGPPAFEVVVYRSGGCESWREALSTVKSVARELDVKTKIRVVKVRNLDEASRLQFHGSPSVVIEGIDVEGPAVAERPASYG